MPGVYIFKDQERHVLYVGKAKRLSGRLRSYWDTASRLEAKTRLLVNNATTLTTIRTPSEFEALLLEARLIRILKPTFNARLRDDTSPLYIVVTEGNFPSIRIKRKSDLDPDLKHVFGPFLSARHTETILRAIRRVFPYCAKPRSDGKPCFWWHLGLCPGFCIGKISASGYRRVIRRIALLLEGHVDELLTSLRTEMTRAARSLLFEEAADAKNAANALVRIRSLASVAESEFRSEDQPLLRLRALADALPGLNMSLSASTRIEGYDVSTLGGRATTGSMVAFTGGVPDISEYRHFRITSVSKPDDPAALSQMLERRLTHPEWPVPNLVLLDGGAPQLSTAQKHFRVTSRLPSGIPFIGLEKQKGSIIVPIGNQKFRRLVLERTHPGLHLLMHIRDEAHRFARRYHHTLRRRAFLEYNGGE